MQIISSMLLSFRYVWNFIAYIFSPNQFQFLLSKEESERNLPVMESRTPSVYLTYTFQLPDSLVLSSDSLHPCCGYCHALPHHS